MINVNSNFIDDDNKVTRKNFPLVAKLIEQLFANISRN